MVTTYTESPRQKAMRMRFETAVQPRRIAMHCLSYMWIRFWTRRSVQKDATSPQPVGSDDEKPSRTKAKQCLCQNRRKSWIHLFWGKNAIQYQMAWSYTAPSLPHSFQRRFLRKVASTSSVQRCLES